MIKEDLLNFLLSPYHLLDSCNNINPPHSRLTILAIWCGYLNALITFLTVGKGSFFSSYTLIFLANGQLSTEHFKCTPSLLPTVNDKRVAYSVERGS